VNDENKSDLTAHLNITEAQRQEFSEVLSDLARELKLTPEGLMRRIETEIEGRIERELFQEPEEDEADWWKESERWGSDSEKD
jgi:hypothetical protein